MLYKVLSFDSRTGIGRAVEAAVASGSNGIDPSGGLSVSVFSRRALEVGQIYSFNIKDFFLHDEYVRAELDYKSPHPLSWRK